MPEPVEPTITRAPAKPQFTTRPIATIWVLGALTAFCARHHGHVFAGISGDQRCVERSGSKSTNHPRHVFCRVNRRHCRRRTAVRRSGSTAHDRRRPFVFFGFVFGLRIGELNRSAHLAAVYAGAGERSRVRYRACRGARPVLAVGCGANALSHYVGGVDRATSIALDWRFPGHC